MRGETKTQLHYKKQ